MMIVELSIYFDDPDGHCLEFISILEGQPRPELGIITYDEWERLTTKQNG